MDGLSGGEEEAFATLGLLDQALGGTIAKLACPQLTGLNHDVYKRYPGYRTES